MKFFKLLLPLFVCVSCHVFLFSNENHSSNIYVQATYGSFNHEAITQLMPDASDQIVFSKTPLLAISQAANNRAKAFFAIRNTSIPGYYVEASLEALKEYKISKVISTISMKIEMCLLRRQTAVGKPIETIASHPAALKQIAIWRELNHSILNEIPIIEGTAHAAYLLSSGQIDDEVGIIGSKRLVEYYPNLVIEEENIQDFEENYTTFLLAEVEKRSVSETMERAIYEINYILSDCNLP